MLPANLQSLTPDTFIELFEVSGYSIADPAATFRFCNYTGVSYRVTPASPPYEYQAIGCESEGFEIVGQGPIPQPKVTVSNVGRMVSDWLHDLKYNPLYILEGATVTRRLTQSVFLEGGPESLSPARELPPAIFQIEQIPEESFKAVQFLLSSPFDLAGATLPNRPALRTCSWRYRSGECGYVGAARYTRANVATTDPTLDICNKGVMACEQRFPVGSVRFGGFPGLGRF